MQLPFPPDRVMTITSPFPLPGPVRAIILLGDFHSANNVQSIPQIFNPVNNIPKIQNEHLKNNLMKCW